MSVQLKNYKYMKEAKEDLFDILQKAITFHNGADFYGNDSFRILSDISFKGPNIVLNIKNEDGTVSTYTILVDRLVTTLPFINSPEGVLIIGNSIKFLYASKVLKCLTNISRSIKGSLVSGKITYYNAELLSSTGERYFVDFYF